MKNTVVVVGRGTRFAEFLKRFHTVIEVPNLILDQFDQWPNLFIFDPVGSVENETVFKAIDEIRRERGGNTVPILVCSQFSDGALEDSVIGSPRHAGFWPGTILEDRAREFAEVVRVLIKFDNMANRKAA